MEDNPADFFLFAESMRRINFSGKIHWIDSGERVLHLLSRTTIKPALIILDLNLPGMSGHRVLQAIKSDATRSRIPIVIFSSSSYEKDIDASYQGHANSYIVKPDNFDDTLVVAAMIRDYWFQVVNLPERT